MIMNQKFNLVGAFPTQRRAALPRPRCSEKYAKVARSSPGSDAPHCPRVVSNELGHVTSTRSSPGSGAPHCLSVVSSELGQDTSANVVGQVGSQKRVKIGSKLRLATWNVGSLTGKLLELGEVMKKRKINIMCLQETKWIGQRQVKTFWKGSDKFKLWYSGQVRNKNGVGIMVDQSLIEDVVEVYRKNDRIMRIKIISGSNILNVISAYAPQVGSEEALKKEFWENFDEVVQSIPTTEKLYIGGDLNGHVGLSRSGFECIHGGFGYGTRNEEGEAILDFALSYDLMVVNTWFKKRDSHLVTYRNGVNATQIDFFLTRRGEKRSCLDCKVIPGEATTEQHKLLVMDIRLQEDKRKKLNQGQRKVRWWRLKDENIKLFVDKVVKEADWTMEDDANKTWIKMRDCISRVAKDILGESSGKIIVKKDTTWWNEDVKVAVKRKKECYLALGKCNNEETKARYKDAKSRAKEAVREAKLKVYKEVYEKLDSKEGEKDIYRMARRRHENTKDLCMVKCVKDKNQKILVQDEEIKDRWMEYFDELFNGNQEGDMDDLQRGSMNEEQVFIRRIRTVEIEVALKKMKVKKAIGPDNIPIEVWRYLGQIGLMWLTDLFNKIWRTKIMPQDWRRSTIIPIYKNKGDAQECSNYRGIKLMSHTMKLWERVIEHRLRRCIRISENQFGFMPGRSTIEAIHLLRQTMAYYKERRKDLHLVFIDLEKAYDKVPREVLWWALKKKGVPRKYIEIIQDMYDGVETNVRTCGGVTKEFPLRIGLHQGSALSPFLFAAVLDEITFAIQDEVPWCMLFADDIVLVGETREGVNKKLELWRRELESKGFKLSRSKTEYMECRFSSTGTNTGTVRLGDKELQSSDCFKYLGSIFQKNGNIDQDVTHRSQCGWLKWRSASGVLCDRGVPLKLKGKYYRTAIRPALLYGSECWAFKNDHRKKMGVAEMRMLRWMSGYTLRDRIRNDNIRKELGVANIENKMKENRLRWFGHVQRREEVAPVRRVESWTTEDIKRGRGRPKMTWMTGVKNDLREFGLEANIALDRNEWRRRIYVNDSWD